MDKYNKCINEGIELYGGVTAETYAINETKDAVQPGLCRPITFLDDKIKEWGTYTKEQMIQVCLGNTYSDLSAAITSKCLTPGSKTRQEIEKGNFGNIAFNRNFCVTQEISMARGKLRDICRERFDTDSHAQHGHHKFTPEQISGLCTAFGNAAMTAYLDVVKPTRQEIISGQEFQPAYNWNDNILPTAEKFVAA
jgi:hypothetical protein